VVCGESFFACVCVSVCIYVCMYQRMCVFCMFLCASIHVKYIGKHIRSDDQSVPAPKPILFSN